MPLQIRRGTELQRTSMTQPLAAGELLFVLPPTNRIYVGDGTTLGGIAVTGYTDENAQDAVAPMFTGGSHSGINFVYNDASNIINATVDLSNYNGTISASSFKGTLVADDSTALVDAVDGRIFLDGTVKGNIVPDADVAYDLGSATYRFRDLYLSGSSIKLGAATITATGTAVNLPAGSTIGGSAIGIPGGDLNVNIVADDSTVIVNTTTQFVTAQGGFIGNVTGNVTGNVSGIVTGTAGSSLVGNVTGNVTGNVNGIVTGTAGSSLVGNVTGNVTGNVNGIVTGTAGSTLVGNVTGDLTGNVFGDLIGDLRGSVFADDSSAIVNAENRIVTAAGGFIGNVTGNLTTSRIELTHTAFASGFLIESDVTTAGDIFTIRTHHNATDPSVSFFSRSRGTTSAPTSLAVSDGIFALAFSGTTSDGSTGIAAAFSAEVAAAPTAGVLPGSLIFSTTTTAGAFTTKLKIGPDGLQTVVAPALVAGASSGQVNVASIASWMKVNFNGVNYAVPMYTIVP